MSTKSLAFSAILVLIFVVLLFVLGGKKQDSLTVYRESVPVDSVFFKMDSAGNILQLSGYRVENYLESDSVLILILKRR